MTSRPAQKNRAFTLIELSVVIVCMVLIAALVMPRLATVQRSIDAKLSYDAIQRLAAQARETAMRSGRPVALAYEETESRFELRTTNTDGDSETGRTAALHEDILPQHFYAGLTEPSAADWTINFYPDGSSDGGGFEVDEGGTQRSFIIGARSGLSKWQNGGMPAAETERWEAGEYERRG